MINHGAPVKETPADLAAKRSERSPAGAAVAPTAEPGKNDLDLDRPWN
jgi:hypothetical protein